ncbi:DUF4245 domain-containing protein [Streptomyces sp. NBC_01803]|uniref:DUF4245 domain-containing protein n=1 Tax=Streptomyces sp. NBC_01803 TaxID=2975946 RepID=UPI002DDA1404|nr:DUF4245 domain-containing protein [Streptomyces sp. NBC_01803]WSA45974.1 DUF4245 domain-containing protein [Streptomyces sp. NBC_01803]
MANDVATDTTETATDAPDDAASARPDRRRRLESVRNMVLSMAALCAAVLALFVLNPDEEPDDTVQTMEYDVASVTAARAAPYDLLSPEGLSDRWRATSVRYDPRGAFGATWRLGFLDPGDEYAALTQADGDPARFITEVTRGAEDTGATERVDGRDWARYEGSKYDALVLTEPDVTTVVMGTAPWDRLAHLAGALEVRADRP